MPTRGVWAIDQLKDAFRREGGVKTYRVVGLDPGIVIPAYCVDMDDTRATPIRYTAARRRRDTRSGDAAAEAREGKPRELRDAEAAMAGTDSRAPTLADFLPYVDARLECLDAAAAFYGEERHRRRRWKTEIKRQQSEERFYAELRALRERDPARRQILVAYGAWGLKAGQASNPCNRGNPPCVGVALMRRLARRVVVAPTPEHHTSKTCCKCGGAVGRWREVEDAFRGGKEIRGLRRCTERDCMTPFDRDKNGATNIGANFLRLARGDPPLRALTAEEGAFHDATVCLGCD